MGSNPINLAIRFILELAALVAMGIWGWRQSNGWLAFVLAAGIPIMAAAIWGVFTVPGDPSRSGQAPVPVPGPIRLLIELTVFFFGTWAIYDLGYIRISRIMGIIVMVHYLFSYDRIFWLFKHKSDDEKNIS